MRHRKRPKKALLNVDLANLPGPKPELEEGNEGIEASEVENDDIKQLILGDISETDEEGCPSVKLTSIEK